MRAQPECMGERGLSTDGNTGFKQRILGHHPQLAHKRLPLSTHDPLSGRVTVTDMSNLPISPFWRRLTDALTERGPKYPEPRDPDLTDLLQLWAQLHPHGRAHVLRTAKNEYSAQSTAGMAPFNNPKIN